MAQKPRRQPPSIGKKRIGMVKMTVLWDVSPCNLVEIDRRFRSGYRLHHQVDELLYFPEIVPQ
jgi:hypothetical protein